MMTTRQWFGASVWLAAFVVAGTILAGTFDAIGTTIVSPGRVIGGGGTAGSPATQVVTVQGISGATAIPVNEHGSVTGGDTVITFVAAGSSVNCTNIKASAAKLKRVSFWNRNATEMFVTTYNTAGTPTAGTNVVDRFYLPPVDSGTWVMSDSYATGLGYCMHTAFDGTGNTTVSMSGATFSYQ